MTTSGPGGTYDGGDDTAVALINNSTHSISSINLSSATLDIFGFEGDGIDTYGAAGNTTDTTGYGGADAYFSNITNSNRNGTVNFITAIAPGSNTFFSLEEAIDVAAPPVITGGGGSGVAPEPSSLILLGTGALGLVGAVRRRFAV